MPHLPAFFPDSVLEPADQAAVGPRSEPLLLWRGTAPPGRYECVSFHLIDEAIWRAPRFGRRHAPLALVGAASADAGGDPMALVLRCVGAAAQAPDPAAMRRATAVMTMLVDARIGGATGLPDPGPGALGLGHRAAVLVIDPCAPAAATAAEAMWRRARAAADGRPVVAVRSPHAPKGAAPCLATTAAPLLAPWTLLDAAAEIHLLDDPIGLLALAAGVPVRRHDPTAPLADENAASRDPVAVFVALIEATRCADPFRRRPWTIEEALRQLADWRIAEAANRRIAVCTGMAFWKRRRTAAAFASEAGTPAFRRRPAAAVAEARRRGGAIAAWATRVPPGLPERAAAAGVPMLRVEDGFVRSTGLGAGFLPGASLAVDMVAGLHLDPSAPGRLESLFVGSHGFGADLLARAARLRDALLARGVTKYNLIGSPAPVLGAPAGARRVLVPGQVEDDLSVRLGATGAVRTNRDLLRAARAEAGPGAFLIFKPHPDVEAGYRRGRVPEREALAHADRILADVPMAALLEQVDAVHTITSLTGFEALLRGLQVVCWGTPFYAGWGLTEDRAPIPSRRTAGLTVDHLVAAALILYPQYVDPVTELPCPVEVVLDRLGEPALWRPGALGRLRRWQGRAQALLRRWAAA